MHDAVLRKPTILPLFNPWTIGGLLVLVYFAVTVYLQLLWGNTTGPNYLYVLMLLQAVPVVIAITRKHFTYLSFIMINHFFQLSLPKWFLFRDNPAVMETFPKIIEAVQEQTACTAIMILVYYASRAFVFNKENGAEKFQLLTLSRFQVIVLSLYVLFVPLFTYSLPAWFLSIHFMLLSADMVLLFSSTSQGNERLIWVTQAAAILGSFNYFLNTGMMTLMGAMVSLGALVSLLKKRYGVAACIFVAVLMMSAIQSVKGSYRQIIYENWYATTEERLGYLWELLYVRYIDDDDTEIDDDEPDKPSDDIGTGLIAGFMRAGDDSLERVLAATPSKVPFWGGETYLSIPYMFIPRAFWGDKPTRHFWNKYGRVYGVLSDDDFETSVGVSYLAEAYMNFGYPGMYLLAVMMGILFVLVERSAFYVMGGHFYFPYIVFLTPLLAPGTDLGSMLNSLWVLMMVFVFARPMFLHMARRDEYS